jgi:Adenosine-deaminase (editase) domain
MPTALETRKEEGETALAVRSTPVRHVEKRRTGTCKFADRVAKLSLEHFRAVVPLQYRRSQPQTCVATIVAHVQKRNATASPPSKDPDEIVDKLAVVALGVGTKFLTEATLRAPPDSTTHKCYGDRVRDCHAEVLARRAFRRHLLLEILHDLQGTCTPNCQCQAGSHLASSSIRMLERVSPADILDKQHDPDAGVRYQLRRNVTLHFYCSSAPCGNAVLKKFCTIKRETFQPEWKIDEWPVQPHPHILPGHSLQLGQFVLLCKKDNSPVQDNDGEDAVTYGSDTAETPNPTLLSAREAAWPCHKNDDWCPAGTTTVWTGRGSLHTCSDKIARWNMLGLQGGYVAPFLSKPLFLSTLVVGRKFSSVTCRRAVCCRLGNDQREPAPHSSATKQCWKSKCQVNHPAALGTGVYMDEDGVIDALATNEVGQDVRFHSTLCWAWWPGLDVAECIDGSTGLQQSPTGDAEAGSSSSVSSSSFVQLVREVHAFVQGDPDKSDETAASSSCSLASLALLRKFKQELAPEYEEGKATLLSHHPVLRHWKRRSQGTSTAAVETSV